MSIFVGLRLADDDLDMIDSWLQRCAAHHNFPLLRPIHRDHIHIPLAYSNSTRLDHFEPAGVLSEPVTIEFGKPNVKWLGERNTVILEFTNDWVMDRMVNLIEVGFPRRHKKLKCRLPMSIHSSFLNSHGWLMMLPKRSVRVVEEIAIPFDNNFGKYAHLPAGTC